MSGTIAPADETELLAAITDAVARRSPLSIAGGGTKTAVGRPVAAPVLSMARLTGVTLYEPAEMTISALAGTPLAEIEAILDAKGQALAFEPPDFRALLGTAGAPTIGAIAAANLSGPRRIMAGACRDALIGLRFVNGRGEAIRAGGRVTKNVTGLDLVKLQAGAWGTLGPLVETTFKALPRAEAAATVALDGLDDVRAVAALAAALGSPLEISGAAHLPASVRGGAGALTLARLEGFAPSVAERRDKLLALLRAHGTSRPLEDAEAAAHWREIRGATPLAEPRDRAVWRASVPPSKGPGFVAAATAGAAS
ncbi:MAG: FAD-binding protein, partial [Hyphomicrobiales bacterium]|nr:FAD-binding protein [Hyphomicrobiales bacterium]